MMDTDNTQQMSDNGPQTTPGVSHKLHTGELRIVLGGGMSDKGHHGYKG